MKKLCLLLLTAYCCLTYAAFAQQPQPPAVRKFTIDQNSIVKDSAGKVMPFAVWSKEMRSREYVLVPEDMNADKVTFIMRKATDPQRRAYTQQSPQVNRKVFDGNFESQPAPAIRKSITIDENSVVRDSSGVVYPYIIWKNMVAKGDYYVQPVNITADSVGLLLKKRTEQQLDAMMAKWKKPDEARILKQGMFLNPSEIKILTAKSWTLNYWQVKLLC